MLKSALKTLLGSRHKREAKKLQPLIDEINEVAEELSSRSDEEIQAKTAEFKQRIADATAELRGEIGELREQKRHSEDASDRERLSMEISGLEKELHELIEDTLEDILPEAFAVIKDACRRLLGKEIVVTGQKMTWDMVPYDVQLIGGIALHRGKVAEMATGEGKTLVATMPLYLNALAGRGAHLVTVNSYLAQRDAEWMGTVYRWLGLSVDVIDLYDPGSPERQAAYGSDITYGTNNEFGFDYLRDNMVHSLAQRVQRGHAYAIIDEVDSILIDEARTPLIISGPVGKDTSTPFKQFNPLVSGLYKKQMRITNELVSEAQKHLAAEEQSLAGEKLLAVKRGMPKHKQLMKMFAEEPSLQTLVNKAEADFMRDKRLHEVDEMLYFAMDEKGHNVHLSDRGLDELSPGDPEAFVVPDLSAEMGEVEKSETLSVDEKRERVQALEAEYAAKSQKIHVIHQLLKAYTLFQKDEKYIIADDGSVVIVDEFTGRQMAGRRWSDGLHQAVEAKEGVEVRGETQTLATITIQNYFRMYDKLSGMTGTAETEENEFHQIYTLDVLVIPTNRPIVRDDRNDLIFRTKREKFNAIMDEIERLHKMELPVLVGTTNVDVSETLSRMLKRRGLPHQVLNAKHHKSESEIVRDAGQPGAVTIATNMAGRGTDIKLGAGVTDPRTVAWAKAKGLDPEEMLPVDPVRAEKMDPSDDEELLEDGGLHIVGSERHESRRIDRQLRGRAGRQGDPGATQFFLSLEDDLMRLFGSERIANVMDRMGAQEGEVITHGLVTKSIERAQKRVEMNNFEARKRLLDYDDVMNQQREVIYDLRLFALEGGRGPEGRDLGDDRARRGGGHRGVPPRRQPRAVGPGRAAPADPPGPVRGGERAARGERSRGRGRAGRRGAVGHRGAQERLPPQARQPRGARRGRDELHHAQRDRRQVEGPPVRPRSPQGVDQLPRLGAEGPPRRVQAGGLRDVRGPHDRPAEERRAVLLPGAVRPAPAPAPASAEAQLFRPGRRPGRGPGAAGRPPAAHAAPARPQRPGREPGRRRARDGEQRAHGYAGLRRRRARPAPERPRPAEPADQP